MKVLCYNIQWDLDEYEDDEEDEVVLPETMEIFLPDDADPSIEGADHLSDLTGFCVSSFNFEVIS